MFSTIAGSRYFFGERADSHDWDYLYILDLWPENIHEGKITCHKSGADLFFEKNMSKNEYIEEVLSTQATSYAFKFLIPEFADYIGLTISDLTKIGPIVKKLEGTRAEYYVKIYNSYLQNKRFSLTDEQLEEAYESYKKYR